MVAGAAVAGAAALTVPAVASAAEPTPPTPSAPTLMVQAVGDTVFAGEMIPADNACLLGLYPTDIDLANPSPGDALTKQVWPKKWDVQIKQTSQLRTYVITGVDPGEYNLAAACAGGKIAVQKVTIAETPAIGQIAAPLAGQFGSS